MPAAQPKIMTATDKDPIHIELFEDYAKIFQNLGGLRNEKIVSIDTLTGVFKSLDQTINLPLLPLNCRKYLKKGQTVYMFLEYPEAVIDTFKHHRRAMKNLTIPRCLLCVRMTDHGNDQFSLQSTSFFALKEPMLNNEDVELYWWPFCHQYHAYMGDICWGTNKAIPDMKKSMTLFAASGIHNMFFSSDFTDDYGWNFNPSSSGIPDFYQAGKPFPYDKLKPHDLTLKKVIKRIMTGQN